MSPAPPSPGQQIAFLQQLQRILSDGSFVATYKFALLHALADLAVTHGEDSGAELPLTTHQIAERVTELYWRQALPFPAAREHDPPVLQQNTGRQAAIISRIREAQREHGPSLARLRARPSAWTPLVREVERVVRTMPLWKLQTVGEERLEFLYENLDQGDRITLRPGVAYCLRAFHDLILDLVRGAWLRYVRTQNAAALGEASDLGSFLFGSERSNLALYQPVLRDLQDGQCFYCAGGIKGGAEVDHFVPWARYPVDLGHNFVLAHAACNRHKADHLAAEPHLERWLERNERHGAELLRAFRAAGAAHDLPSSVQVTRWAYEHTARINARVWREGRTLEPLSAAWAALFGVRDPEGPHRSHGWR